MNETEVEMPDRKPPKKILTSLCIAVYLAIRFVNWYFDLPSYTDNENICWLLGLVICLLWDLWEAVMYSKTVTIKSLVVNVTEEEEEE